MGSRTFSMIALAVIFGIATSIAATPALNDNVTPMTIGNVIENPSGLTIELAFPSCELVTMDRGNGESRIWLNMPGSILDFESDGPALPVITKMIAVPDGYRVEARVISSHESIYECDEFMARDDIERHARNIQAPQAVEVGEPGWMRWLRIAPVTIRPARYDWGENHVAAADRVVVEFDFIPDGTASNHIPDIERYWSQDFESFFNSMLLNPEKGPNSLPGGLVVRRGSYVIITDEALGNYQGTIDFAAWKRRKGFDAIIAQIYHDGMSAEELKEWIQNAYDTWERPPEYILLLGDVNMPGIRIPTFRIQNPGNRVDYNVTDWPFTLLRGDDYFPEIFIGRISTDSPTTSVIRNALSRIVLHEQNIADFDRESFHNATIFAGNYGDGGNPVLSPVETSKWLAERLAEMDWEVDTFFYRGNEGDVRDSGPIIESIDNLNPNIVSYRGWADARGTHYPQFYLVDLEALRNTGLLPVMTFFVCNTGDFGNDDWNPCFGEYSISRGSRRLPSGALSFFGPSDLHTSSRYNNAMLAGYYAGLLYQNMRTLGQLTLRGKIQVWAGFPHERVAGAENNYVEFYFHVYNILGDPELTLYRDYPVILDVTMPEQIAVGSSMAHFEVLGGGQPVKNALVIIQKADNEFEVSVLTDQDGIANVPVSGMTEGEALVTILGFQAAPVIDTLQVATVPELIDISEFTISNELGGDQLITGSLVEITVTLANYGESAANGVTATLISDLNVVTIESSEAGFGDIDVNHRAVANQPFVLSLLPRSYPGTRIPLYLEIHDGDGNSYTAQMRIPVVSGLLKYLGHSFSNEIIDPGDTDDLTLQIENLGSLGFGELRAELNSFDGSVEIIEGTASFEALGAGEAGDNSGDPFRIRIADQAFTGRNIAMRASFYDAQDREAGRLFFNCTVGDPGPGDPLGPDAYGYYVYENNDDERYNDLKPTYDWIELDPEFEGQDGQLHELKDDTTFVMDLPFSFTYYGNEFNEISICSNGWFSFENTWMFNFRNWDIPSPLGPHTLIAPFWEDLVGQLSGISRLPIKVFTRYDENEGRFIIEWSRAVARTSADDRTETFEAILLNPAVHQTPTGDGDILFQYNQVEVIDRNEGNYATVGFEDWMHVRGLEVTYSGLYPATISPLEPGRTLRITTHAPDPFLGSTDQESISPWTFSLSDPYPNPFNSTTTVGFTIPDQSLISLNLFDLNGRLVKTISNGHFAAGSHTLAFTAEDLASGIYLLRLQANGANIQRKVVLLK